MNYVENFNFYGVDAKEIPCIKGEGAPTETTEGAVGCLYMDTLTGDMYKCTNVSDGIYTWVTFEGEIVQTMGDSETAVMSQKAVTDELNGKIDRNPQAELMWELGDIDSASGNERDSINTIRLTHFVDAKEIKSITTQPLDKYNNTEIRILAYNANYEYIGYDDYSNTERTNETILAINAETAYIKILISAYLLSSKYTVDDHTSKVTMDLFSVEERIAELEEAVASNQEAEEKKASFPLSAVEWIEGKAYSSAGGMMVTDQQTISCEEYFKTEVYRVNDNIVFADETTDENTRKYALAFYDVNKTFVRRSSFAETIVIPENAIYFRISARLFDSGDNSIGGSTSNYNLEKCYIEYPIEIAEYLARLAETVNKNADNIESIKNTSEYIDYETFITKADYADLKSFMIYHSYNNYYSRKPFNILHCTDLHSRDTDIKCFQNAIALLEKDELDCMILSGDLVASHFSSSNIALETEWAKISKDVIFCVGNHDVGNTDAIADSGTDAQVYSRYYAPHLKDNFKYNSANSLETYNTANPSEHPKMNYYVDYDASKIRIISLYQYCTDMAVNSTDPSKLAYMRCIPAFRQTDIDWLLDTLASVPVEYTVLVVTHEPENFGNKTNDWQSINLANSKVWQTEGILTQIFTAYKNKTVVNTTRTQTKGVVTTITANYDFSSANGDFGAWILGHTHDDFVGKSSNGELNIISKTCDNLLAQTDSSILKVAETPNENALNVISVDTEHKTICVKRIGAKMSRNGDWRNVTSITY